MFWCEFCQTNNPDKCTCSPSTRNAAELLAEDDGQELEPIQDPSLDTPDPLVAGTFAIYGTPDQGFMLVTDTSGRGVERRHIPGRLVRLFTRGPMARALGQIFGG